MSQPDVSPAPGLVTRLRDYAELVRLPNLFTAMADVLMGFLVTHRPFESQDGLALGLLLAASACLYAAGVVLNDVFDVDLDVQERPERPLPSGRIGLTTARRLGGLLLALGFALAVAVGLLANDSRPGVVGGLLAACILLYDGYLKRIPAGPVGMGACRMLNVLLGMSVMAGPWQQPHWLAAAGLGTFIVGVTWFARGEAHRSHRLHLTGATVVILAGIGVLGSMLPTVPDPYLSFLLEPSRWYLLIGLLGMLTGWRCVQAIVVPTPPYVQGAVVHCLQSIIFLDAAVCSLFCGLQGVIILALLIPAAILGRWVHST